MLFYLFYLLEIILFRNLLGPIEYVWDNDWGNFQTLQII